MVVRALPDGALAVGQLSHAWLSGQLARRWGNALIASPQPREAVALGAEQHDIGWSRVDLAPILDRDSGLPRNFLSTSVAEHLETWRDAPARLLTQSLHAALAVSLHGGALSRLRLQSASAVEAALLREHIAAEGERQRSLAVRLGLSPGWLERTRLQMWAWDGISLALCSRWSPFSLERVPTHDGQGIALQLRELDEATWTIEPWPFEAQEIELACQARRIAGRHHDQDALSAAWERAEILELRFALVPPERVL